MIGVANESYITVYQLQYLTQLHISCNTLRSCTTGIQQYSCIQ